MQFTLKDYEGHKYLEYYDEENGTKFTNAEYFIFDTICEDFKDIMSSTGGFVAEMTTRMIKEKNLPCESIMLCQSPLENNTFAFQFVYLDKNRNVLHVDWDNNYFDYKYFKKKFSDCVVEQGCIFDLKKYDCLQEVTKEFKIPTVHFNIEIDGREITPNDVLVCEDLCFLKEEYLDKFRSFGVVCAELEYGGYDHLRASHFKAKFVKEDGSFLPRYQGHYLCETIEEFRGQYGEEDDYDMAPFDATISVPIVRHLSDHFSLKDKEREEMEL